MAKKKSKQRHGKKSKQQPKKSKAQEKREKRRKEQREQRRRERERQRHEKERQKEKQQDEEFTNPDFFDEEEIPDGMSREQWDEIKNVIDEMLSKGTLYYHAKQPERNLLNASLEELHEYNLARNEEYQTYITPILGNINADLSKGDFIKW